MVARLVAFLLCGASAQGIAQVPVGNILVDEGHHQAHTLGGVYSSFGAMLRDAGYTVAPHRGRFTAASISNAAVIVIANPFPEPRDSLVHKARSEGRLLRWSSAANQSAFDAGEIAMLRSWVEGGGSLLIVLDHAPHGATTGALTAAFDVQAPSLETTDSAHLDPPRTPIPPILFTRAAGLLADHGILRGVDSIASYGGGSMVGPPGSTPLLRIPAGRLDRAFDVKTNQFVVRPAAGRAQALALSRGRGRVVILGEAAMLTSDRLPEDAQVGGGIGNPALGNRAFAINTIRWLTRAID